MPLRAIVSHWWTCSHSQKAAFARQEEKHIWKHRSKSLSGQGGMEALWESSCYLPQTAAWTALKCLHGQTLLLSASVPHACKLCSGVFPLERKFVYSTSSSSSCFPSHQHSPRWSHGSSTAQGFKWRQKRLKSVLFLPPVDQLAKWQDHCPLSLEEGVGAQFGCAHGGTLSHWSCPFALSHGTWKPIQLEKSKYRWS